MLARNELVSGHNYTRNGWEAPEDGIPGLMQLCFQTGAVCSSILAALVSKILKMVFEEDGFGESIDLIAAFPIHPHIFEADPGRLLGSQTMPDHGAKVYLVLR